MNDVSALPLLADPATDPMARARALGPAILAAADQIERTQTIPEPLWTHVLEARLARMLLPRSAGGDEVEPWVYLGAIEEISRFDASLGWNLFVANSAALIAPFIPLESARTIFANPRAAIAWGPPNHHTAVAERDGYRISGEWHFASGCRQATWMGAHASVIEPDGTLRLSRTGRPIVLTLLFPAKHATHIPDWDTLGLRGTASEGYTLDNLFVPEAFTGTREDPASRRDPGPLYAFTMQGLYAVGAAGVAFGIARAMLDAMRALAVEKSPRGLERMADNAVVQAEFAKREGNLGAARAYLVESLTSIYANAGQVGAIGTGDRVRLRLACAHGIAASIEIADYVYKAAGTSAIFRGTPFERRFRDMHTLSQQIQARDAHFEAVGRVMFNGDPEGSFL